ncbi:MAG: hypothetical protein IPM63_11660 [Acidobacteriota bacterium]|nr:MAG: hypothetical protein IPM63_11660 [Acidobacteriota bacterium]
MKTEVSAAIEELGKQFPMANFSVIDDGQGGARIIMEPVVIGKRYSPEETWFGFHITAQYPYSDIYPVLMGADVRRVDGVAFTAPVTPGHQFEGRPAIQISRRNAAAESGSQRATAKVLKILDFLEGLQ